MSVALDNTSCENSLFDLFEEAVARRFDETAGSDEKPSLFSVDAGDLYALYLGSFSDPVERQHHNCHCCRQFIQRFGNLASINGDGSLSSVMWQSSTALPPLFQSAASALARAVERGKVTGFFVSNEKRWGIPSTGEWHHFSVFPQPWRMHQDRLLTPYQVMAQKKQDFGTLSHGLAEFDRETVAAAVNLLDAEAVYRAEKVRGPAAFLLGLHGRLNKVRGERRKNLIWKAVATAPVGFATPRSAMIGTLLDDIASGMALDIVKRRFADKIHPLQYQRPQAAPAVGNIAQAEAVVAKLGIAPAFRRRFARIDEVRLIWSPAPEAKDEQKADGIFGHLRARADAPKAHDIPKQTVTWVKFAATVLPKAKTLSVLTQGGMNFVGVVTAEDADAPPILQWDREDARNPISWYLYHGGSMPKDWHLPAGEWVDVTGIMLKPSMWARDHGANNHGNGAIAILKGQREARSPGLCLFPEILRSDLHSIRSTIEAYSKSRKIEGADEGTANGLMLGPSGASAYIRAKTDMGTVDYLIDRWD